jgi:hypothetical protein
MDRLILPMARLVLCESIDSLMGRLLHAVFGELASALRTMLLARLRVRDSINA